MENASRQKQMFIDDFFIESMIGARAACSIIRTRLPSMLRCTRSRPTNRGRAPLLAARSHYDEKIPHIFGCTTRGLIRTCALLSPPTVFHWERPNLGLVEYEGFKGQQHSQLARRLPCHRGPAVGPARDRRNLPLETDAPLPPTTEYGRRSTPKTGTTGTTVLPDPTTIKNSSLASARPRRLLGARWIPTLLTSPIASAAPAGGRARSGAVRAKILSTGRVCELSSIRIWTTRPERSFTRPAMTWQTAPTADCISSYWTAYFHRPDRAVCH